MNGEERVTSCQDLSRLVFLLHDPETVAKWMHVLSRCRGQKVCALSESRVIREALLKDVWQSLGTVRRG